MGDIVFVRLFDQMGGKKRFFGVCAAEAVAHPLPNFFTPHQGRLRLHLLCLEVEKKRCLASCFLYSRPDMPMIFKTPAISYRPPQTRTQSQTQKRKTKTTTKTT